MKYFVTVEVLRATGQQVYSVEAGIEQDALSKWQAGEGDIVIEELEAQDFGKPTVEAQA